MAASSSPTTISAEPFGKPKVVYVMGAGRSGSTILGIALGNCADFFYAGELDKWLPNAGVPPLDGIGRARFWSEVRRDVRGADSLVGYAARCLERSSSLFRARRWMARRRLRAPYRRVAEELYRAVSRNAGVTRVVDTSHYPLRARELQRAGGVDLYLVFLVRDPQNVVASFARSDVREPRFGTLKTNAYLWLTHLLSVLVFLSQRPERRVFLRYEDFIANPEAVLRGLLGWLDSPAGLPDLSSLRTGIPIEGNRIVREEVVSFERQASPSARRSRVTTLLQLPWVPVFARLRPVATHHAALR
jgi:sulfotransferase family protein